MSTPMCRSAEGSGPGDRRGSTVSTIATIVPDVDKQRCLTADTGSRVGNVFLHSKAPNLVSPYTDGPTDGQTGGHG